MPPPPPAEDAVARVRRCGRADLWGALGLARGATEEVARAYKRTALAVHPDKQPEERRAEAGEAMAVLVEAKEVLTDPTLRRMYGAAGSWAEFDGARRWARDGAAAARGEAARAADERRRERRAQKRAAPEPAWTPRGQRAAGGSNTAHGASPRQRRKDAKKADRRKRKREEAARE